MSDRHARHTRRLEATKEVFYDLSAADGASSEASFGGGLVDHDNDDAWINCYIPWDFSSLKDIVVVMIPQATLAAMTLRVVTNYCHAGENIYVAGETVNKQINAVASRLTEVSIADCVDVRKLTPNDYIGVDVRRIAGQNTNTLVLGVRIRYNTPIYT